MRVHEELNSGLLVGPTPEKPDPTPRSVPTGPVPVPETFTTKSFLTKPDNSVRLTNVQLAVSIDTEAGSGGAGIAVGEIAAGAGVSSVTNWFSGSQARIRPITRNIGIVRYEKLNLWVLITKVGLHIRVMTLRFKVRDSFNGILILKVIGLEPFVFFEGAADSSSEKLMEVAGT